MLYLLEDDEFNTMDLQTISDNLSWKIECKLETLGNLKGLATRYSNEERKAAELVIGILEEFIGDLRRLRADVNLVLRSSKPETDAELR